MSFVRKNDDDKKPTFGVIVGNRDVFPDNLAKEGRLEIIEILTELGYDYIITSENDTKYGVIESFSDAKKCADLFKRNRDKIIGILVIFPNFGNQLFKIKSSISFVISFTLFLFEDKPFLFTL